MMNDTSRQGLGMLGAALVLGVLGDGLLRTTSAGVNIFLWFGALIATMFLLARWLPVSLQGGGRWLLLPVFGFAAAFAWRDSTTLKALDALALLLALSLVALRSQQGRVRVASLMEYVGCLFLTGMNAGFGSLLLIFGDVRWRELPHRGWLRYAGAVGRGLLLALPLLLVFGGLFMSADAVFERFVGKAFHFDLDALFAHLLITGVIAWMVGGYLRLMLRAQEPIPLSEACPRPVSLGMVEIGIVLGLLDLLFFSFVLVQLRYLFGGGHLVETTTGMTYATYARRGFFELVTVATLSLPLLLSAHWLLRVEKLSNERLFQILAGVQLCLLTIIMASALQRMHLYQKAFGLTELRLYTTAFMGWLGIVFAWFAVTVLRGQRDHFAFGALVSGFAVIALLHVFNPDARITQVNIARATRDHRFDAAYATSLSADAVPTLVAALPRLDTQEQNDVLTCLRARWADPHENYDWRGWSLARAQAFRAIHQNGLR